MSLAAEPGLLHLFPYRAGVSPLEKGGKRVLKCFVFWRRVISSKLCPLASVVLKIGPVSVARALAASPIHYTLERSHWDWLYIPRFSLESGQRKGWGEGRGRRGRISKGKRHSD